MRFFKNHCHHLTAIIADHNFRSDYTFRLVLCKHSAGREADSILSDSDSRSENVPILTLET